MPLVGAYVFGDECTGVIRAVTQNGGRVTQAVGLHLNVSQLTTFGQGPKGALFAASRWRHDLHDRGRVAHSVGRGHARTDRGRGA